MWARKIPDTFGDAELVVTDDTTEDEVRAWLHDQYGALELLASAMGLLIRPVED